MSPQVTRSHPKTGIRNGLDRERRPDLERLSLDGAFWRRLARLGATRGPGWFVRLSPPLIGLAAYGVAKAQRRQVARNLRRIRGERSALRDAVDVARTFAGYASCLAEILSAGSPNGSLPEVVVWGEPHVDDALADGRGIVFATAHTAGWETVGPLMVRDHGFRIMIAEAPERDAASRAIQDDARRAHGLLVVHVGDDPLAALPLARHLREGGAVALQMDRAPAGLRARTVALFGERWRVPEGPLRLAALTGAPLVPVFVARTGHRSYKVFNGRPIRLARAAGERELDDAAQSFADSLHVFLRAHPTQWFHFHED
ncbi:MAG: lysophospholipid acyltransferase family protein [Myxococcota bacterium]|nr:lysophospholipid acyltransferase family protein [Myxococcota bacterium]